MDQLLLLDIGKLLLGVVILVISGDLLVRGGVAIANHFKISTLVVGLTVVAFGTSVPELMVSLKAAIGGHPEFAIGNVIGSNIANISLVLALTVIILPIPVVAQTIKRSWPIMLVSGLVLYFSMYNGVISRIEGIVMFILLISFIIISIKSSKNSAPATNIPKPNNKYSIWIYIIFILISSIGLNYGSEFLVDGAGSIAYKMGVSERVVGLTIVAFGTSVPELTASLIAAFKKETDISVGNIIGSNIFNVFAVIGITSGIHIIPVTFSDSVFDLNFMLSIYILLFIFIIPIRYLVKGNGQSSLSVRLKKLEGARISRIEGAILFIIYVYFIIQLFKRTG